MCGSRVCFGPVAPAPSPPAYQPLPVTFSLPASLSPSVLRQEWFGTVRADLLAGAVVALALIPEAIAFSIIAGVDPKVGLYASFTIAVTTAFVGGRPGMISAATGAMALLMITLVKEHGLPYLFAATILTGAIQFAFGAFRLGRVMKFVPKAVMTGFVNALAILIFMAQLPQFVGVGWEMYAFVAAGLAIIYGVPRLTTAIPSPLIAIVVLTLVSLMSGFGLRTVGDMGALPTELPVLRAPVGAADAGDAGDPLPDLVRARARRPHRVAPDGPDRGRADGHGLRQEPRGARPGHRQRRHRVLRRDGRLRHDRPVRHQRVERAGAGGSRRSRPACSCSCSSSSSASGWS